MRGAPAAIRSLKELPIPRPRPAPDARRARRTARRLDRAPDRLRWVLLVSMVAHVAALALLKLLSPSPEHATPRAPVALEVVEVLRPEPLDPAPQATPSQALPAPDPPPDRTQAEIVAATQQTAPPREQTEREAARDQRRHDAPVLATDSLHPGTGTSNRRVGPPGGRHEQTQDGAPLTERGGRTEGRDRLARGRRAGGGHPGGGHHGAAGPGRPRGPAVAGADGRHQPAAFAWAPLATRLRGLRAVGPERARPPTPADRGASEAPRRTRAHDDAPAPSPRPPVPSPARPVPAAPAPVDGAEPTRQREPLGDPVADLRESLGWGPLDRSRLAPRPLEAGRTDPVGGTSGGGRPVPDASSWTRSADARGTELGAWAEQVDLRVYGRWAELELPMEERARGLQGDVTVRYHVLASGRVRDVVVVRSSGHASLDALAVSAVPARLPRPPPEARPDGIVYEHRLGYRNPLVLISPP